MNGLGFRFLSILFVGLSVAACDDFKPAKEPVITYVSVLNPSRDTIIAVLNEKKFDKVEITFESTLSDTALVRFSNVRYFSDEQGAGAVLPVSKDEHFNVAGIKGDSLFIQYKPNKSKVTSGQLKIGAQFKE